MPSFVLLNQNTTFTYQLLDANFIKTTKDNHYRIFYGGALPQHRKKEPGIIPITAQCLLPARMNCYTHIHEYYIQGEKYQQVIIWKAKSATGIYLLNSIENNFVSSELGSHKHILHNFYCLLFIVLNSNQSFQSIIGNVKYKFKTVIERNITIDETSVQHFTVQIKSPSCLLKANCHHVYKVNNTYTKIEITKMTFNGWKAPSCLYGGVSFYDSNHKDTEELTPYYKEIYTVCDNYTFSSSLEKKYTKLFSVNNEKFNLVAPFYSASKGTIIVVYSEPDNYLNVTFSLSHSNCRGVFVNPCGLDFTIAFPFQYTNILHYQYPFDNDDKTCLTVQLSSQYLVTSQDYNFNIIQYGCMKGFIMKQNYTFWCGAHLKFLQLFQIPRYFVQKYVKKYDDFIPLPDDNPYESANFLFSNILTNSSKKIF